MDLSCWRFLFSTDRRGRRGFDVIFRVEQDHRVDPDGNDRCNGLRDLSEPAYPPKGAGQAGFSSGRRQGSGGRRCRAAGPAGPEPIGPFHGKADPKKGEQIAKVCATCHTFNKGGPNKIGPNLWGITEEEMAAVAGYQFSAAMEAHKGEKWDPEKLNQWLYKPQAFIKGTKMTFVGIPKEQDRADIIGYLETLK